MASEFTISVSGLSDRDKEKAAAELTRSISQSDPTAQVKRQSENPRAQSDQLLFWFLAPGACLQSLAD
jgi:hypothetical protein